MGKAYRIPGAADRLRKQQIKIKNLEAINRNKDTPRPVASTAFAGKSASSSTGGTGNFLSTFGGTITGPFALGPPFDFSIVIDADGIIDIGSSSTNDQFTSNIQFEDIQPNTIVLDTIAGAAYDGQLLVLRTFAPSSSFITISQATFANGGNIQTLTDADFNMGDLQTISLIFDESLVIFANTGGTWRVWTQGDSGGNGQNQTPWLSDIDAAGFSLNNLLSLDIEDSAGATKLGISGPLGVGARFQFIAGDSVIFTENITDRLTISAASVKLGTDLDYNTFDGINIDRLKFTPDSGSTGDSDPTIYLDGQSNMVFNVPGQDQFFWTNANQTVMALDTSGVNNDTILTVQTDSADASAIPQVEIFRDDPTPQSGAGGDSEITNLDFIGTNAAVNGGASAGASIYSKIITIYESVITGREASSLNFFTSFDTGVSTQLKAFLGLNNSNSEEIEAFVDLDMSLNDIVDVNNILGRDDGTLFKIIFDSAEDSDTFISSNTSTADRIDFDANGVNSFAVTFDTGVNMGQVGIPFGSNAFFSMLDHFMIWNEITEPVDGLVGNSQGNVFFDDTTDPPILMIKKKNSVGGVSVVSLEASGGGSQTPWLSDINANFFNLQSLSNLEFNNPSAAAPTAGVDAIFVQDNSMVHNVANGGNFDFREQGGNFLVMDAAVATFTVGTFQANANVVNLGVNASATVNVIGLSTFLANANFNEDVTLGNSSADDIVFNGDVVNSITPNVDNLYDLGSASQEWRDLFIDGTANIDIAIIDTLSSVGIINSSLVPSPDNNHDLGSTIFEWRDLFIDGIAHIDTLDIDSTSTFTGTASFNGDVNLGNSSADDITFNGDVINSITPNTDNIYALGSSSLGWADLFLGSNGFINFDGSTVTTIAGNSNGMFFDVPSGDGFDFDVSGLTIFDILASGIRSLTHRPFVTNTSDLGSTTSRWREIFSNNVLNVSLTKFKKNITELNDKDCLNICKSLRTIEFEWKDNFEDKDDRRYVGFDVDELEKLLPNAVKDDMFYPNAIIGILLGAVRDLEQKVADLSK